MPSDVPMAGARQAGQACVEQCEFTACGGSGRQPDRADRGGTGVLQCLFSQFIGGHAQFFETARQVRNSADCDIGESEVEIVINQNSFESVVFEKHVALPVLLAQLHQRFRVTVAMSGSGSACFALLENGAPVAEITAAEIAVISSHFRRGGFVLEAAFGFAGVCRRGRPAVATAGDSAVAVASGA